MRKSWIWKGLLAGSVTLTLVLGGISMSTNARAAGGGCRCPLIYAPVVCDHNKTYPNQCEADCHNAKNCVPVGIFGAQ